MQTKDWSNFKLWCSGIYTILSRPKGITPLTEKQIITLDTLNKKEEKTAREFQTQVHLINKAAKWDDPPLSKGAVNYLTRRYGWEKYAKKMASRGTQMAFYEKGNLMEAEAIDMLSKLDKTVYSRNTDLINNDYLLGCCEIVSNEKKKVVDVKVAWNISTFLNVFSGPLKPIYWYQMQGYLELYDMPYGEVCFCLLNTPEGLIEREKVRLLNKYVFGEISREDYDKHIETLELSLTYNNIPIKRRIIRFRVDRRPEIIPQIYKKVDKCRLWLADFERSHIFNKEIITLPEHYAHTKEDHTQSDPDESCEID